MDCPFCTIEKERIIKEGKHIIVILSNPRLMLGHLLVIPKRHVIKVSDLDDNERKELFNTIVEFQEKILSKIASGCDIRQHCRPFQKQDRLKVDHLHFHLQPRELYDELYEKCQIYEKDVFKDLSQDEQKKMKNILEKELINLFNTR